MKMKALVYYGPEDLRFTEIEDLKPAENEVLIRIKACGICGSDVHGYMGITGRRIAPMVMGHEFAGVVHAAGENAKKYNIGDRVTVQPVNFCGKCVFCQQGLTNMCTNKKFLGVLDVNGAMAEYVCIPEHLIYRLPNSMSYIQGAMLEPLAVAYRAVKNCPSLEGKNVLIVGAGTIGLLALQLVRLQNPHKVFVTDLSDFRLETAKRIGADITINPSKKKIEEIILNATEQNGIDVAIEAVGVSATVQQAMSVLKTGGTCKWIGNSAKMINLNMQDVVTRELNISGTYIYTHEEFGEVVELLASGKIDVEAIISKKVTLEEGIGIFKQLSKDASELIKVVIVDQ